MAARGTSPLVAQMVQEAHGITDVAATPAGESSTPPVSETVTPAPREEAISPEVPAGPDPQVLQSTIQRVTEQRDQLRSAQDAMKQEMTDLQEQLRQLRGEQDLREFVSKNLREKPEEDIDDEQTRLIQAAQSGAEYIYKQMMANLDATGLQKLSLKEAIRTELGEDLTHSQLDVIADIKWGNRGLTAAQARILAQAEKPDLFESPSQPAEEPLPSVPATHRVQMPTSESRSPAVQPKKKSLQDVFHEARARGDRRGMREAFSQRIMEEMVAPAWDNVSHDGTGRVVKQGERLHIPSPYKSRR